MKRSHHRLIVLCFFFYALTFLPNFGILNSLTWIGPLPLPMAWVLFLNALNTVLLFVIYQKYFLPFAQRADDDSPSNHP